MPHDQAYLQVENLCKLWLAGKIIFCGFQEIPGLFKNLDYFARSKARNFVIIPQHALTKRLREKFMIFGIKDSCFDKVL